MAVIVLCVVSCVFLAPVFTSLFSFVLFFRGCVVFAIDTGKKVLDLGCFHRRARGNVKKNVSVQLVTVVQ